MLLILKTLGQIFVIAFSIGVIWFMIWVIRELVSVFFTV